MLTSAMLMLIGDTVAQYLETEEKTEDLGSKKFMIVTPNNLFPNGFKIDPTRRWFMQYCIGLFVLCLFTFVFLVCIYSFVHLHVHVLILYVCVYVCAV
eukprot:m.88288 g.88288  ORF g.88288 m.88288 type:complete len:98 (+) comp12260_c1_seq12:2-295(+)